MALNEMGFTFQEFIDKCESGDGNEIRFLDDFTELKPIYHRDIWSREYECQFTSPEFQKYVVEDERVTAELREAMELEAALRPPEPLEFLVPAETRTSADAPRDLFEAMEQARREIGASMRVQDHYMEYPFYSPYVPYPEPFPNVDYRPAAKQLAAKIDEDVLNAILEAADENDQIRDEANLVANYDRAMKVLE